VSVALASVVASLSEALPAVDETPVVEELPVSPVELRVVGFVGPEVESVVAPSSPLQAAVIARVGRSRSPEHCVSVTVTRRYQSMAVAISQGVDQNCGRIRPWSVLCRAYRPRCGLPATRSGRPTREVAAKLESEARVGVI